MACTVAMYDGTIKKEEVILKLKVIKPEFNENTNRKNNEVAEHTQSKKESKIKPREEIEKHRYNARLVLLNSNATPIRAYHGIGYCCSFCTEQFASPANLKKHTLNEHDDNSKSEFMKGSVISKYFAKFDITGLRCKICGRSIDTLEDLFEHLKTTHYKKIHTDINNHILPFKFENEDVIKCFMCSNEFINFKGLLEHMSTHYKNYTCDKCNAGFVNRALLYHHSRIHITGNFKCNACDLVLETLPKLNYHKRKIHKNTYPYKCGYCIEGFSDHRRRIEHLAVVHGIKRTLAKCQACDKSFTTVRGLKLHLKRYHLLEKDHKCSQCTKRFFSAEELSHHMVKHTGVKQFRCAICFKSYGRKKTLKEHMRIHNNDRKFKCQHCGQAFVQKCSLKGHLRSKHGKM
ncbi:zinc finger protein 664-like [Galleria mellonella]|uniref:Zinc finger protein 664-like n=1 Tax=Galleria mellonella TaxID=7137 RepID=A0A6J1W8P1_GALME|nr:zinc finger protein 664-like [Galleria mellonella]